MPSLALWRILMVVVNNHSVAEEPPEHVHKIDIDGPVNFTEIADCKPEWEISVAAACSLG